MLPVKESNGTLELRNHDRYKIIAFCYRYVCGVAFSKAVRIYAKMLSNYKFQNTKSVKGIYTHSKFIIYNLLCYTYLL